MDQFKHELGETVTTVFNLEGVVTSRGTWESITHPQPTSFYVIQSGKEQITVSEAEIHNFAS